MKYEDTCATLVQRKTRYERLKFCFPIGAKNKTSRLLNILKYKNKGKNFFFFFNNSNYYWNLNFRRGSLKVFKVFEEEDVYRFFEKEFQKSKDIEYFHFFLKKKSFEINLDEVKVFNKCNFSVFNSGGK